MSGLPEEACVESDVLASMTLAEKARLCAGWDFWTLSGVPRLGVPAIRLADGPHGLRKPLGSTADPTVTENAPATCFPTASALAATWDPALVEEVGVALGEEARAESVSVLLGPGANIKRTPLCGRNFEYFAEDPLLSGRLAAAWITGVQRVGVAASLKHFAANNQEHRRYTIDALVDERALREIYLSAFEYPVRHARPWTVMTAYNRVNGVFCSEHAELLDGVLRGEWGFDGVVVSDWGATNDRVAGLVAGLDLEMPGYGGHHDAELVAAVESGRLPVAALDAAVDRILTLIARTAPAREPGRGYDPAAHHDLARRVATDAVVLLKNDGLLPLPLDGHVAVIGAFARRPRFQGAGSSAVTPHRVDDAYSELTRLVSGPVSYAPGYHRDRDVLDEGLLAEAFTVARRADTVLVFAGLTEGYETEGVDRTDLRLPPAHDALIATVTRANPRVAVVLSNGAPVEMPWHETVPAIVESHLGGQAGGSAVARVLLGQAEPGGRLAETFPLRWSDNPVHALPVGPRQVEYRESVLVGYRYYDSAGSRVLFPFGHGLSYTTFAYSDLAASRTDVAVRVANTGPRPGAEVVQVYLHASAPAAFRPAQELAGFAKVRLGPGESRRVTIALDPRAFERYEPDRGGWTTDGGRWEVRVGASSRDIRLTGRLDLPGPAGSSTPAAFPGFDRGSFAAMYRRRLPDNVPDRRGSYTLNTPLMDMRSLAARLLLAGMRRAARRVVGTQGPLARLTDSILTDLSLRMLLLVSRGVARQPMLDALLLIVNGRRLKGAAALLRAVRQVTTVRRR